MRSHQSCARPCSTRWRPRRLLLQRRIQRKLRRKSRHLSLRRRIGSLEIEIGIERELRKVTGLSKRLLEEGEKLRVQRFGKRGER